MFLGCLLVLVCLDAAGAQPHTTLLPPRSGVVDNLVTVPAPAARWVALSETHHLLAFAHDISHQDAHVSLVKLDDKGQPLAYGISWKLPKPEGLTKNLNHALSVAFHPKLPLLYVWQEINQVYTNPPQPEPPDLKLFDHLLIYSFAKEPPELVLSLCRGPDFLYGMAGGALAADAAGEYLYVPNLRDPKNAGSFRFGRFRLDADGRPLIDDNDAKLPVDARTKKLADANVAKGILPAQVTPIEYVRYFPNNAFGAGHSFHIVSRDAIIAGGPHGLMTWRPEDREACLHGLPLGAYGNTLLSVHPSLPLVFATVANTDSFYRVEQSEGYLSLLPLQLTIPETRLYSQPVTMTKSKKLAIGGHHHVYFMSLGDKGDVQPEVAKVQVLGPAVRALAYSEKFDRLYVGVESSK